MPLDILGPLVVFGILGIAAILHLGGHSQVTPLSPDRVAREWQAQFPDAAVSDMMISDDGRVALVRTDLGTGMVWTMGADTAARLFDHLPSVRRTKGGLDVRTGDFTAPRIRIALKDAGQQDLWLEHLSGPSNMEQPA